MNELSILNQPLPAYLQAYAAEAADENASFAAGISVGFPRISIKQSRFRIVRGDTETVLNTLELPTVLIAANPAITKAYYAKGWVRCIALMNKGLGRADGRFHIETGRF